MPEVVVTMQDSPDGGNTPERALINLSPEEEVAQLRQLVAEKDHAVIRAFVSTTEMQQQLETSRAESVALKAQLDVAREKPQAALQAAMNGEVLKLNAKFNHARKTLEREHAKVRSELITLRAHSQQLQHQLENEKKARQIEAARASGKIASLEQDLSVAYGEKSESGRAVSRERTIRLRLSAAAVSAAIILAVAIGWLQMSAKTGSAAASPPPTVSSPPRFTTAAHQQMVIPSQFSTSQHEFQSALGRLNNDLANFTDRRPEEILADVRSRMASSDPSVCAFEWNGGQPALLYGGQTKTVSLASTISKCAQAVEKTRLQ